MAARALIRSTRVPRSLYVAGLLVALLAALLGAWFVSGWHDVRMRQHEVGNAPRVAADRRTTDLARELHGELESLIVRETRRPYFHYQNLMHDPNASAGLNVSPSPLARGSEEKLVLGYFQLDATGSATTPTINDELPDLSERDHFASNRAFRDQVNHDLSRPLAPLVTSTGSGAANVPPPTRPSSPTPEPTTSPFPKSPIQVVTIDPGVYAQNQSSNRVYSQQGGIPPKPGPPPAPVTITISPLEWRTLSFRGVPTLLAIRVVQTPDGALTQGFVVDRSTLTSGLTTRAAEMVPDLHPDDARGVAIAPGWGLTVDPSSLALAQATDDARSIARTFLIRFFAIGSLAAFAAGSVVMLVMRSEKFARERSEFAAAAAHELRTPLAGLQLYGDMIADGLGDAGKTRDYARRMSEDASRLGRVVSNMLGFSQLERGNLSVDARPGPLGEMLFELAERARPALGRAGATLQFDVSRDLRARFDADALTRIIGNLLDNAEKYSRGADDRTIRFAAHDRGGAVEVCIEDRGPGVTDKTKLFRAFSRGVHGGDGPAGLGLGLALSTALARDMGGELAYKPRDGGGATFVLQLPRA